jgi:hypothetical protein
MRLFQSNQITVFHLLNWLGLILGANLGGVFGWKYFGLAGAIVGGLLGLYLGGLLGFLPARWAGKLFFNRIEQSTTEELWAIVNQENWNFYQTMALLHLAGRGENVQSKLEQILTMLESDEVSVRLLGWDALRLVFIPETKRIEGYAPKDSIEECQKKVNHFRASNG